MASFQYYLKKLPECSEIHIEQASPKAVDDIRKFVYAADIDPRELGFRQCSNPAILDASRTGDLLIALMSHPSRHRETISHLLSIFQRHHPSGEVLMDEPDDTRRHNIDVGINAITKHVREEHEKTHGRLSYRRPTPKFDYGPASNDPIAS